MTMEKLPAKIKKGLEKLNHRQLLFVMFFLKSGNATQAAIDAGYSPKSAGQVGHKLLKKVEIKQAISSYQETIVTDTVLSQREALEILSRQARSDLGKYTSTSGYVDIEKMKADGVPIKKITVRETEHGSTTIVEVPDNQHAIVIIGKMLGWDQPERHEHTVSHNLIDLKDLRVHRAIEDGDTIDVVPEA